MTDHFTYRWQSPHDWLRWKDKDAIALSDRLATLLAATDADAIQDLFQSDMDADGYFDPLSGVYKIEFEPDDPHVFLTSGSDWRDDPLYASLVTLGCEFLRLTFLPNGVAVAFFRCPLPLTQVQALDGVESAEAADEKEIERVLGDRKLDGLLLYVSDGTQL